MSYDLFFRSDSLSRERFFGYFGGRANYQLTNEQAFYENQDTGVYFIIELVDAGTEEGITVQFILNYYRPCVFAVEAAIELDAFCGEFGCRVLDPQDDDEDFREFSSAQFVVLWNRLNRAFLKGYPGASQLLTIPQAKLEYFWNWNYNNKARSDALGDDIYSARLMLFERERKLCTVVVWTDGIPTVFPQSDLVLIYLDNLAPRRFLVGPKKKIFTLATFDQLLPVLEPYGEFGEDGAFYMHAEWGPGNPPAKLVEYLRKLPVADPRLTNVELAMVMEEEAFISE